MSSSASSTEIIAPEDSVLIIRAPGVRDMYIRVPLGIENRVVVSYSPIEKAERTQVCTISAGHLVTVRTPHHGNIMIPLMPTLCLGRPEAAPQPPTVVAPQPPTVITASSDEKKRPSPESVAERLSATRKGSAEWEQRCAETVASYQALVAASSCPVCKAGALVCPHFGLQAIAQWVHSSNYRGKNRAMTLNILSMELRGLIQTRRPPAGDDTFMGIARFFVDAGRRDEFNRESLVPEWWALDCRSAAFKGAVESWRTLGWVSVCFANYNDIVMFVYSRRLCEEKRKCVNVGKNVMAERRKTAEAAQALEELKGVVAASPGDVRRAPYSQDFKTIREEVLLAAIVAEPRVFGVCPYGPRHILGEAMRLVKRKRAFVDTLH